MTQFSSCCKEEIRIHIFFIEKPGPRVNKFDSVSNCQEMKTHAYSLVSFPFNLTPQTCGHYLQSQHGHKCEIRGVSAQTTAPQGCVERGASLNSQVESRGQFFRGPMEI